MSRFFVFAVCVLFVNSIAAQNELCPSNFNDCDWLEWGKWTSCSKDCGQGTRSRSRGICCESTTDFAACKAHCKVEDLSFESETCGNVCPTNGANCTFDFFANTSISATQYQQIKDGKDFKNPPMMLHSKDPATCSSTCNRFNLVNGMRCWSYEVMDNGCEMLFFPEPLTIANQSEIGQYPGENIYLRNCPEFVPCRATLADVIFVVDSSGSIGESNFGNVKNFLKDLVNRFDIDQEFTRVGLLLYNEYMAWQFKLGEINDKDSMLKALDNVQYVSGGTSTHEALDEVRLNGFTNNTRTGVPKIAIFISDGVSKFPGITKLRAALLRRMGVQVYALGVGNYTQTQELYNIASSPEDQYVMKFQDFVNEGLGNVTFGVSYVPCKEEILSSTTTVSPIVTPANNCTDAIDNCAQYGRDMCTDYAPWAHANCALYCEFCKGPPKTVGPCVDAIPNCASYGTFVCSQSNYVGWVDENCRRYCGLCGETTTTTTTPVPTTTEKICEDRIADCYNYDHSCQDPKFSAYLRDNCPETCGFCHSYQVIHGQHLPGMAAKEKCPDWWLPKECSMEKTSNDCCPQPKCPSGYLTTAELDLSVAV